MPMLQKFGKILSESILQNEEGQHVPYHQEQIEEGTPLPGDEIVYDCTLNGWVS